MSFVFIVTLFTCNTATSHLKKKERQNSLNDYVQQNKKYTQAHILRQILRKHWRQRED